MSVAWVSPCSLPPPLEADNMHQLLVQASAAAQQQDASLDPHGWV